MYATYYFDIGAYHNSSAWQSGQNFDHRQWASNFRWSLITAGPPGRLGAKGFSRRRTIR